MSNELEKAFSLDDVSFIETAPRLKIPEMPYDLWIRLCNEFGRTLTAQEQESALNSHLNALENET